MVRFVVPILVGLVVGAFPAAAADSSSTWEPPKSSFTFKDYLLVPLRIHLLSASNEVLNTTLTKEDFDRILPKMNQIWAQAGVSFYVESIVCEAAQNQGLATLIKKDYTNRHLLPLRPEGSRATNAFDLYFIKEFRSNGVYLRDESADKRDFLKALSDIKDVEQFEKVEKDLAQIGTVRSAMFIKDSASLKPIDGGIDEPLPRVSSHEIGHAFGLNHRQNSTNLMASGTTGVWFNELEILIARHVAQRFEWIRPAPKVLTEADRLYAAGDREKARELYRQLDAIPLNVSEIKRAKQRSSTSK